MSHLFIKGHCHKWLAAFLTMILLLMTCPVNMLADDNGSCGEDLTWSLSAGTLTITGSGDMENYTEYDLPPWYEQRENIVRIELPDGLTRIGSLAFFECANVTAVVLPDSVETIGQYAFAYCENLALLDLSNDLKTIGRNAFYFCEALISVRLPEGLQSIGMQAFYHCIHLTSLMIPATVQEMGVSVFAYCYDLVRAEVQANLVALPDWTFYSCTQLTTVVLPETISSINNYAFYGCEDLGNVFFSGSQEMTEKLKQDIVRDLPTFASTGNMNRGSVTDTSVGGTYEENEDGTITMGTITVQKKEAASISTKVEYTRPADTSDGGSYSTNISVTIDRQEGWNDASEGVLKALEQQNDQFAGKAETTETNVTVYVREEEVDTTFVESLAGRDIQLTVVTRNGSEWKLDCSTLNKTEMEGAYTLTYMLELATAEKCEKLGVEQAFRLHFTQTAQINAEVLVRLPYTMARQAAILYEQEKNDSMVRHQAVVVDKEGCAHFYLAAVNHSTDYYIAIDAPENVQDAIIPDELLAEYGNPERYDQIEYVVTGRKSSWGLNIGQVTWIMIGVLAGIVVIVGTVMTILDKRKWKRGAPQ